ncbi:MAG: hypothetical protein FWG84_09595 [Bacteroidales bacterium]|nr:hypothetical protein [Bacteroidales bacterium]
MEAAVKTQSSGTAKRRTNQTLHVPEQEPKRLSKFGIWRQENPGGIGYIKDRRAINKMRY